MIDKRLYEHPTVRLLPLAGLSLLIGSEKKLPTDPTDGTDEALSKGNDGFWDEWFWEVWQIWKNNNKLIYEKNSIFHIIVVAFLEQC